MRLKAPEVRVGKRTSRAGRPRSGAAPKPLPTLCSHPQPAKPCAAASGLGRGLGKTTKTISSRNVHLQLEGTQGQALLSQPMGGT